MKKFYAVRNGRRPGIYTSWDECKRQVIGYKGAVYKGFETEDEARAFIGLDALSEGAAPSTNARENAPDTTAWAYVDGSFDGKRYAYGAVIFDGEREHRLCEAFEDEEMATMRNVAGELEGCMSAVSFCLEHNIDSITIYYDYTGIGAWANGDWKTNKDGTRRYAEFIKAAREKMRIDFVKVKGHSGNEYNDIADELAKSALGIV